MGSAKQSAEKILTGHVDSLTLQGEGVVRVDGKVFFIDGALPGETVEFKVKKNRKKHGIGQLVNLIEQSDPSSRLKSDCDYFGVCGGCSLRHYEHTLQLKSKENALLEALEHIGKVTPERVFEHICGDWLHYRRKARLGIRFVEKKGGALVGFREKRLSYITPLDRCLTLTRAISDLLPSLAQLVNQLSVKKHLPQIEVAHGDNQISLVFRHLQPLNDKDHHLLEAFSKTYGVQSFLQPKGLDSIHPVYPHEPEQLYYELSQYGLRYYFSVTDFIQVNAQANELLLEKAISLLAPQTTDKVLDLYCGLGNFTLPIAQQSAQVFGVEGDKRLVDKALFNASFNDIKNAAFQMQDLSDEQADYSWLDKGFDKVLLDPARSGAKLMSQKIAEYQIPRIVYVSCNPATMARDADLLVNQFGYRLKQAGIVNMFPHTAHIESIALFEK